MKRGFQSGAVTPVGITIVVCTVITRESLAHDQMIFFVVVVVLYPIKRSVLWWQSCIYVCNV